MLKKVLSPFNSLLTMVVKPVKLIIKSALKLIAAIVKPVWVLLTKLPIVGKYFAQFADYLLKSNAELKKVTWPKRKEATRLTLAVIAFTAVLTVVTVLADWVFRTILDKVFLG